MAQQHPRAFLAEAEAIAQLPAHLTGAGVAAVDQGRAAQRDLMGDDDPLRPVQRASPIPHAAEFLALSMSCLEAMHARTVGHCRHVREPYDLATHLVVDLTIGWVSCGCRQRPRRPRQPEPLCNLCARSPGEGMLYEAMLTVGPLHTFRAEVCGECWDWIQPLYDSRRSIGPK